MKASEFLSIRNPLPTNRLILVGLLAGPFLAAHESEAAGINIESKVTSNASSVWVENQNGEVDENVVSQLSLKPEISLSRSGNHVDIISELSVLHYISTGSESSITTPAASIRAIANIIGETYVVGAEARGSRRIEDTNSVIDDRIDNQGNNETIYNFSIQQNVQKRLGSNSFFRARHGSSNSQSTFETDIGSSTHALEFQTDTVLSRRGLIGSIRGGYQITDFENSIRGYNGRLGSEIQWPLTSSTSVITGVGYEWFRPEQSVPAISGELLYLGISWNPTLRLSAEIGYTRQAFGESPRVKISYSARRSGLELSWTRELQSSRLTDFNDSLDSNAITTDPDTDDVVLDFNGLDSLSVFLDQQRSINEILTLRIFFNTQKTNYTAQFSYVDKEQIEVTNLEQISKIARFEATRKIGRSLELGLSGGYSSEIDENNSESNRSNISLRTTWNF